MLIYIWAHCRSKAYTFPQFLYTLIRKTHSIVLQQKLRQKWGGKNEDLSPAKLPPTKTRQKMRGLKWGLVPCKTVRTNASKLYLYILHLISVLTHNWRTDWKMYKIYMIDEALLLFASVTCALHKLKPLQQQHDKNHQLKMHDLSLLTTRLETLTTPLGKKQEGTCLSRSARARGRASMFFNII